VADREDGRGRQTAAYQRVQIGFGCAMAENPVSPGWTSGPSHASITELNFPLQQAALLHLLADQRLTAAIKTFGGHARRSPYESRFRGLHSPVDSGRHRMRILFLVVSERTNQGNAVRRRQAVKSAAAPATVSG
jgi:hypothetical protein